MPNSLRLSTLLLLAVIAPNTCLGICKWTDSTGVTHYAESCPEIAKSSEVTIETPPTQERIESAKTLSQDLAFSTRTPDEKLTQEQERDVQQQDMGDSTDELINACAEARWNLEILRKQRPVYFDNQNQLHFNRSLYDLSYEGPRIYLGERHRQAEIARFEQVEERSCTSSEDDIRARIKIYMEKRQDLVCIKLRGDLGNMKTANTGIPSDKMRNLEELINTRCN